MQYLYDWVKGRSISVSYICIYIHNFTCTGKLRYVIIIIIIIIIIVNISPRKLMKEPQMRSCSSHLSNKNVLSNFRKL